MIRPDFLLFKISSSKDIAHILYYIFHFFFLIRHRPSATRFPIIVSQDCGHLETSKVIQEYVKSHNVTHIKVSRFANPRI